MPLFLTAVTDHGPAEIDMKIFRTLSIDKFFFWHSIWIHLTHHFGVSEISKNSAKVFRHFLVELSLCCLFRARQSFHLTLGIYIYLPTLGRFFGPAFANRDFRKTWGVVVS